MILVDSSVWIGHFRKADPVLQYELNSNHVVTHPLIIAELALGSLQDRVQTIKKLERLPYVESALLSEVRVMVEVGRLHGRGIGVVDAHLLASALMTPLVELWTHDKRLHAIAKELGIAASLP